MYVLGSGFQVQVQVLGLRFGARGLRFKVRVSDSEGLGFRHGVRLSGSWRRALEEADSIKRFGRSKLQHLVVVCCRAEFSANPKP